MKVRRTLTKLRADEIRKMLPFSSESFNSPFHKNLEINITYRKLQFLLLFCMAKKIGLTLRTRTSRLRKFETKDIS